MKPQLFWTIVTLWFATKALSLPKGGVMNKDEAPHLRASSRLSARKEIDETRNLATARVARDAVIVIDGSGSIDSSDWELQKSGFIAALKNPIYLPRDGSVALTVVQFANLMTNIEFEYTVIVSEADVEKAVNAIANMGQFSGGTNPGDGVATATSIFRQSARGSAIQTICMSTDGIQNEGQDLATALDNAKNADFALDSYSVIAIEDPPNFNANDFQAYYSSLVFGGGQLLVVRNAAEFANTVGSICFGGNNQGYNNATNKVNLVGIEVVQVIQDLKNSVDLIEMKETWVRVYFEAAKGNPIVQARLRGRMNGVELPWSPLTASNPQTVDHPSGTIVARQNALQRRMNADDSLNFQLSKLEAVGTIELEIEPVGTPFLCSVSKGPFQKNCKGSVTFKPGYELKVLLYRITYDVNGARKEPPANLIPVMRSRLLSILPINSLDIRQRTLYVTKGRNGVLDANGLLESLTLASITNSSLLTHGVLPSDGKVKSGSSFVAGKAKGIPGDISFSIYVNGSTPGRDTPAHEVGHSLGLPHTYTYKDSRGGGKGVCGEDVSNSSTALSVPFPFLENVSGTNVYTIGPLTNVPEEDKIFGWDTNTVDRPSIVVDPSNHFELMSYCKRTWRWVSSVSYKKLQKGIEERVKKFEGNRVFQSMTRAIPSGYLLFRAIIDLESNVATFSPTTWVSSWKVPDAGVLKLVARDKAGDVVSTISFQPDRLPAELPTDHSVALMLIPVLSDLSIAVVSVEGGGLTLGTLVASPNPPQVTVVFPNGGEVLNGSEAIFSWNASDADGDTLTFAVQFSADNGNSWITLVTDYANETFTAPLTELGNTNMGLIRVLVSDGFNVAHDTSDAVFTTPNVPPDVHILTPVTNASFSGVQRIVFQAFARDLEDGALAGGSLIWTSNRHGTLGTGEGFNLLASDLLEGAHVISVVGMDSSGSQTSHSIPIQVYRVDPPMNATSTNSPTALPTLPPTLPAHLPTSHPTRRRRRTRPPTPKPTQPHHCQDDAKHSFYIEELKKTMNCKGLRSHLYAKIPKRGKMSKKLTLKEVVCASGSAAARVCPKTCHRCIV